MFSSDLQSPADAVERVTRSEFDEVESVQDRDGFGQFVADRPGVAA
jgi:hypothetical protein